MKKVLLVLVLMLSICSSGLAASSGQCGDNVSYVLDDSGLLKIYGTGAISNYSTSGSPFYKDASIKQVEIGEGVTGIGNYAFYQCENLASISFSTTVKGCGFSAFQYSGLESVYIPKSIIFQDDAFANCNQLREVVVEGAAEIASYMFEYCISLEDVIIGDGASIGLCAFQGCSSLKELQLGKNLVIDANAFYNCTALDKVVIPVFSSSRNNVFDSCTALTEVIIQDGVTSLPRGMFAKCNNLEKVVIPDSVLTIGDNTFPMQGEELQVGCSSYAKTWASNHGYSIDGTGYHYIEKHQWGGPEYDLDTEGNSWTASRICNLNGSHVEAETVNGTVNTIVNPTCTADGEIEYISDDFQNEAFESQTKTVYIPALGHDWDDVLQYIWSEKNTLVTAEKVCKRDATHIEIIEDHSLDGYQYVLEDNEVAITGYTGMDDNIQIPTLIGMIPVTKIGDEAFKGAHQIEL